MKGFNAPPSKALTFTRDEQSVTFQVYALPPLFRTRLRMSWPDPGPDAPDTTTVDYVMRRAVVIAAEGLRRSEEGIPTVPASSDPAVWYDFSDDLLAMFDGAGLTDAEVQKIAQAAVDLSESSSLEELKAEGNG